MKIVVNKTIKDEIKEYDRKRLIDAAMIEFIAKQMASPHMPHYQHKWDAAKALKAIEGVAKVIPNEERLIQYELLDKEKLCALS